MDTDERIARILGAWQDQRDTGESIEPEALVANHPDVAHELAERLAALGFLDLALAGESQPSADAPGRIGDFRILAELGRGGMGVVYEAEQVSMRRKVALKVLSLAITGTPQSVKRFRREAQAAGKLHHTNIVPIYGLGRQGGHWYYAMELVKGRTLSEVIAAMRGAAPTEQRLARRTLAATTSDLVPETGTGTRAYFIRVAEMFAGVADALHLAHQERVIHRDIKPSNLLLDADGTLKIVDFGLALVADGGPAMTMTGDLLGTPAYMSPEQALAKRVAIDHRTDLYSLSATLYEVLTLTAPFAAAGLRELCLQIAWKDPELPRRRDRRIPPDLETIVLRGMEKDRDRRYQSAAELARELRRFAEGVPIHARRIGPVGRTWRRIRRRKVRAALVAAVLLLAIGAGVAAAVAFKERELRHDLEYAKLCASGESYVVRLGPWWLHETAMLQARARERFTRAIAIDPDRPVAYVGRAIAADSLDAALADLERARERGLAPRTYHLARSLSFDTHHKGEEAERERGLAAVEPGGIALDQYIEARILAARGDLDDALECLTRAIELAPHGGTVRFLSLRLRGRLRQEKGDLAGALTDLAGVQAMGDASLDLRLRIASVWRAKGDEKEPERIFEETLREARKSNRPSVWRSLARSCRINAEVAWHERVTIEALKQHPTEPGLLIERAIALEMKSDDNQSEILGLVERALKEAPADHFALVCKGDAQMALHQYSKAVASYRQALLSDKDCFRTLQQLGIALRRIDKPGEALEQFEHALRVKPNDALTFCMKGDALRQNGDYKLAEESYTKAIALDEGESQAYYQRGCLRADNMHRDDDALADFRKALAIDSDHFESQRCCAVIHKKMKQFPEALVEIRKARELKPDSASTYSFEAETLLQWKGIDEALNALDRGVAELPESAELHGMRGAYLCNYRRRFSDAIPDFQKAQELDDQEWTYHAHEAIALRGLGKLRDSIAALDRAIALTNEARPAWLKGEFLLPLAEYEKAAEAYLVAIERDRNGLSPRQGLLHALQAAGSWKRGADAAEEALAKFPADLYLQRSRVRCLRAAGQVDAARTEALRYVDRETPKKERFRFAYLCAAAGDAQRARDTLATMNPDGSAHFGFASVLAAAGEAEDALASLEKAAKSGYRMPLKAVDDPDLDRLLGDRPRYRELMRILRSR